jgi:prepilin-type N-terminal cleavage/methylation domain-containing protein
MKAFTLVELLVVTSILAVLAALLFPACSSVRRSALMGQSISNLHQIGLSAILYAGDNDDLLPFDRNNENILLKFDPTVTSVGLPTNSKMPADLIKILGIYLSGASEVWFCPADKYKGTDSTFGSINHLYTSYMYTAFPNNLKATTPWPWIAGLSDLELGTSLFVEPVDIAGNNATTYWPGGIGHASLADGSVHTTYIHSQSVKIY